jgi:hypothetical protein
LDDDKETRQDYIKRLARQRYEFRIYFKWRLNDTAEDDWRYAEEAIRREDVERANS